LVTAVRRARAIRVASAVLAGVRAGPEIALLGAVADAVTAVGHVLLAVVAATRAVRRVGDVVGTVVALFAAVGHAVAAVRTPLAGGGAPVVGRVAVERTIVAEFVGTLDHAVAAVGHRRAVRPAGVDRADVGVIVLVEAVVASLAFARLDDGVTATRSEDALSRTSV